MTASSDGLLQYFKASAALHSYLDLLVAFLDRENVSESVVGYLNGVDLLTVLRNYYGALDRFDAGRLVEVLRLTYLDPRFSRDNALAFKFPYCVPELNVLSRMLGEDSPHLKTALEVLRDPDMHEPLRTSGHKLHEELFSRNHGLLSRTRLLEVLGLDDALADEASFWGSSETFAQVYESRRIRHGR